MKNNFAIIILTIISIAQGLNSTAQNFVFTLYFEDSIGNRDSIQLGYDSSATSGIDQSFGEINIANVAADSILDARIKINDTTSLKKSIKAHPCDSYNSIASEITVTFKNYPISIYWEDSLFLNSCRYNSVITDCHPGGWFDTGFSFALCMRATNSHTVLDTSYKQSLGLIRFFVGIGEVDKYSIMNPTNCTIGIKSNKKTYFKIYPNPVGNLLQINVENIDRLQLVEIFNIQGKLEMISNTPNVDTKHLTSGFYFVRVLINDQYAIQKIFKE